MDKEVDGIILGMQMQKEELEKTNKRHPQLSDEELQKRFKWHTPQDTATGNLHGSVRSACLNLARTLNTVVPEGREKALAITHLEEVMMWANAGIARG